MIVCDTKELCPAWDFFSNGSQSQWTWTVCSGNDRMRVYFCINGLKAKQKQA